MQLFSTVNVNFDILATVLAAILATTKNLAFFPNYLVTLQ
jgi:hypothetical protein